MTLRLVFAGSPTAAVPSLQRLLDGPHEVAAVITRTDARVGRKRVLTPTPVATTAEAAGVPVLKANRMADLDSHLEAFAPDLGVVVAYGGLIREPALSLPRLGWINVHFSLLPRWRGAAPVQHAVIAGDRETGVSIFRLVPELDAGPVFATSSRTIAARQTSGHLLEALAVDGAALLAGVVDDLDRGTAVAVEQHGEVALAPKLTAEDGRLDWTADAEALDARIRGLTPEPGAFTELDGDRLKVLDAVIAHDHASLPCGEFAGRSGRVLVGTATAPLELLQVQPAGKRPMPAADWWRGRAGGRR